MRNFYGLDQNTYFPIFNKPENTDSVYLCLNKATEQNLNQRYLDEKGEQGHTFNDQTFAQQEKEETVE